MSKIGSFFHRDCRLCAEHLFDLNNFRSAFIRRLLKPTRALFVCRLTRKVQRFDGCQGNDSLSGHQNRNQKQNIFLWIDRPHAMMVFDMIETYLVWGEMMVFVRADGRIGWKSPSEGKNGRQKKSTRAIVCIHLCACYTHN